MPQSIDSIDFPVIAFATNDTFYVYDRAEELSVAYARALTNQFWSGLQLFDVRGRLWSVTRIEPAESVTWWTRFRNRRVSIMLEFAEPIEAAQSRMVEALCKIVDADPDDLYDQFVSHDELKQMFRAAATPAELIEVARTKGAGSSA